MTRSERLLESAAGAALSTSSPTKASFGDNVIQQELFRMLSRKNGFYAFESSLHVFPSGVSQGMDLEKWNSPKLWRNEYEDLADGLLFFAEDIFGGQFRLNENGVYLFDPETAACEKIAPDLEGWADCVLTDYDSLTGYQIARQWQEKHGIIPADHRLVAKMPFVAGGKFELSNLRLAEAVEGMKWRGNLACQIKDLPDGEKIRFEVIDGQ